VSGSVSTSEGDQLGTLSAAHHLDSFLFLLLLLLLLCVCVRCTNPAPPPAPALRAADTVGSRVPLPRCCLRQIPHIIDVQNNATAYPRLANSPVDSFLGFQAAEEGSCSWSRRGSVSVWGRG
jgi:hypothetical protein